MSWVAPARRSSKNPPPRPDSAFEDRDGEDASGSAVPGVPTATDALVGQIDAWLGEGRFDRVIALLERCDAERLAPDVLTGILSLTAHAKASLEPARPAFFERAMAALAAQGVPTPQREQAAARLR